MSNTTEARKIALSVLNSYGFSNKVKAKATNLDCSRHMNNYVAVDILDWTPNELAENIENEIKRDCDTKQIGVLVGFKGNGFIDD